MKDKCNGLWGWLFGHKFQARFNEEEGEGRWPFKVFNIERSMYGTPDPHNIDMSSIINSTKSRKSTYVFDICERCGEIIRRNEEK
jgi:hypothetical protein